MLLQKPFSQKAEEHFLKVGRSGEWENQTVWIHFGVNGCIPTM